MNTPLIFTIVFILTAAAAFYFGIKRGKKSSKKRWEDEIRIVSVKELRDILAEKRAYGAPDNDPVVVLIPEWWE